MEENKGLAVKKYITEDGYHTGYFMDFPGCIIHAKSEEGFNERLKLMGIQFLDLLKCELENKEIDIHLVDTEEEYLDF